MKFRGLRIHVLLIKNFKELFNVIFQKIKILKKLFI